VRVLHLTPEVPTVSGGTGGQTRQFQLLKGLVEQGDAVEVVAPVHPDDREAAEAIEAHGITLHAAHRPADARIGEVLAALRRRPVLAPRLAAAPVMAWQADVFWTALRPLAERAWTANRPDVICVEHDWAAGWARTLPDGIGRAMTLHNLSWQYYESRAQAASGPARAALTAEARRFARYDTRHLPAYGARITMSDLDATALRERTGLDSDVIPNGVDTAALDLPAPGDEPVALFTGRLDYPPNAEALLWLLRDVWPRIRARRPDARLVVVGPNPPDAARELAGPDVEITGFVPAVPPYFARANVVIVPMKSGGGTRLKVLDALASGRGIVSTRVGAMGVEVEDGEQLLLADTAEDLAASTLRLFDDAALRTKLGTAARGRAQERYEWSALAQRLRDVLARASPSA
jgi:glycosyltransferase involved in cell wall biosynthesis